MLIGYGLIGQDNNSYMFDEKDKLLPICKKCGFVTDFDYVRRTFKIERRVYDVSYTYDGRCIVSLKFMEFCKRFGYKGLEFKMLPADPDYFYFKVSNVIAFDSSNLRRVNFCEACGNFESVVPGFPIKLKNITKLLDDKFYATDTSFGNGNGKCTIIIIGIETYQKIKLEKLTGIHFEKVESSELTVNEEPKN